MPCLTVVHLLVLVYFSLKPTKHINTKGAQGMDRIKRYTLPNSTTILFDGQPPEVNQFEFCFSQDVEKVELRLAYLESCLCSVCFDPKCKDSELEYYVSELLRYKKECERLQRLLGEQSCM